ncbi:MAG: LCP family protein [Elusimicrobiota bacterium]|nr:LCP family protein [Elusimicrobiota bacterium]
MKIFFIALSLAAAAVTAAVFSQSSLFLKCAGGDRVNTLFIGTDQVRGGSHSDVVLWMSYEPKTRFVDIVSVPRDVLIKWDERKKWIPRKLSEILYLNTKKHGMSKGVILFKQELEKFLNIKFDYYMTVTFDAFAHAIDALGKIPVTVDRPMHYDDNWGGLHIHFEPGNYMMSGDDALKYVRFRHTSLGDLGRIKRQHDFLRRVIARCFDFRIISALPEFIKIYREDIFTNFTVPDIIVLMDVFRTFNADNQRYQILPGVSQRIGAKDVWRLDGKAAEEIKASIANSDRELWPRSKIRPFLIRRGPESLEGIQAEVFNASGKRGIAEALSGKLRNYGCDVVLWGNWGNYKKYTEVIARTGNLSKAVRTANVLGCSRVRTNIDPNRMVDISVVVGDDFPKEFLNERK